MNAVVSYQFNIRSQQYDSPNYPNRNYFKANILFSTAVAIQGPGFFCDNSEIGPFLIRVQPVYDIEKIARCASVTSFLSLGPPRL